MRKLGLPQVVGAVIAGLLIGPAIWGLWGIGSPIELFKPGNFSSESNFFFKSLAEIGVIMILFSAGLETNVKDIKKTGAASLGVAIGGVVVPMVLGILIAVPFLGGFSNLKGDVLFDAIFVGVILTATSVGIVVECLKEMGKLKGKLGTVILSAAIIDDILGIIVLSIVISLKNPAVNSLFSILKMLGFFVAAIGVGIPLNLLFKRIVKKHPQTRRIPIMALIMCLVYAYVAEEVFGVADITGAYLAGIMLSNLKDTGYIDRKIDINSYMLFSPVFFAYIGISADFSGIDGMALLFAAVFVVIGILGKIIGSGGAAKIFKYTNRESAIVGVGMLARGEVALVVCAKGLEGGLFQGTVINITLATILLIMVTSLLSPMFLKLLFKKYDDGSTPPMLGATSFEENCTLAAMEDGTDSTNTPVQMVNIGDRTNT